MSSEPPAREPLYQRIKRELRELVAKEDYPPGAPFLSQRDVCERYSVSTTTAVRVLNELVTDGLLVRTRGRGTFVAQPSTPSTSTADRPADTIAFIAHGLDAPHCTDILSGAEEVSNELGYRLFIINTSRSLQDEARALRRARDTGAAGIVLYPVGDQSETAALHEIHQAKIPLVMLDRYRPDVPTDAVIADNFAVGHLLTTELIRRGHTRICTLWSETACTSVRDRLSGHLQALREQDEPLNPRFTTLHTYALLEKSKRLEFLSSILKSNDPPTAFLCANGVVLATAAHDLVALGISVPDKIDLASMDDAGPYDLLPLASVAAVLPSFDMGRRAIRLLIERITAGESSADPQSVTLPISIRTRESASAYLRPVNSQSA